MARLNLAHLLPKAGKSRAEDDEEEKDAPASEDRTEDETEAAEDGDGTAAAEDDQEDEDGEAGGEDDEPEASGAASRVAAGFALIRSPEARGRERLAAELGEEVAAGRLSAKRARALLAAAPKVARLAEAMAGRDVGPGAGTGKPPAAGTGLAAAIDRLVAQRAGKH